MHMDSNSQYSTSHVMLFKKPKNSTKHSDTGNRTRVYPAQFTTRMKADNANPYTISEYTNR